MNRGDGWATVHGIIQSWTRLSNCRFTWPVTQASSIVGAETRALGASEHPAECAGGVAAQRTGTGRWGTTQARDRDFTVKREQKT